jgi:hypothetical protein
MYYRGIYAVAVQGSCRLDVLVWTSSRGSVFISVSFPSPWPSTSWMCGQYGTRALLRAKQAHGQQDFVLRFGSKCLGDGR